MQMGEIYNKGVYLDTNFLDINFFVYMGNSIRQKLEEQA